ncbi:MAG: DnaJ domain-containing protein [Halobacteriales archaeon]
MTDYYDVLEVPRDASQADIRRAYRRKVKEYHPDVSDHPAAAELLRAVTRAEAVLGDEAERERYDRLGHEGYLRVVEDGVVGATVETGGGDRRPGGTASSTEQTDGPSRGTATAGPSNGSGGAGGGRQATGPSAGSDNPSRRSYSPWDDGGDDDADGFDDWWNDQFDRKSAGTSTAESVAGAGVDRGPNPASGPRRDRQHVASASPTAGGFWAADPDGNVETEPSPGPNVVQEALRSRGGTMLVVALLVVYPVFVYFSVTPALPPALNALVGLSMALVAVGALAEPGIAIVVFGVLSLLSPPVLVFVGLAPFSPAGLFVLGSFWVPLGLSFVIALAVPT